MLRKLTVAAGFVLLSAAAVYARDKHDHAAPSTGTAVVARADGDTIATGQVTCTNGTAVLVRPAVVDRSRRRLRLQNANQVYTIALGSSTLAASNFWNIGVSTSATNSFDTHNSGAIYCSGNGADAVLNWEEETAAEDVSGLP